MPTVADIISKKGSTVHSTSPTDTVLSAINTMNQHKLGALVVMNEGQVVGMFTERDVLRRVVGEQRDPANTHIAEVMTNDVICCSPETDLDEVSAIMQQRRVRHVPVCDHNGKLRGMISIGDMNAYHVTHQEATIEYLNEYIYGRA